jgi:hypothetical protein
MQQRMRYLGIAVSKGVTLFPWWAILVMPPLVVGWVMSLIVLPGPQDPYVQWLSLLAVAAGLVAFVGGSFLDALSLRHKYPPLVMVGGGLCVLLSAFCLWKEPSAVLLLRLGLPLLLTGLIWFYVFYFSVLHGKQRTSRLQVGDRFPHFALPDSGGQVVTLASMLANGPALTLFYKGDW